MKANKYTGFAGFCGIIITMKTTAKTLPNDPELLKQMVLALQQNVVNLETSLSAEKSRIEQLELRLAGLLRHRFGRSSEQTQNADQLELLIEDTETAIAQSAPEPKAPSTKSTSASRSRKPLNPALPREEMRLEPQSCDCPDCGADMKFIGEDVSEILQVIPEQHVVLQQIRPKYGCSQCDRIAQTPAREHVIDKGLASAALLAQ